MSQQSWWDVDLTSLTANSKPVGSAGALTSTPAGSTAVMVFYTDHAQNVHLLSITPTSLSDSNLTGSASSCTPTTVVPVTGANTGLSSSFANITTNVVYQPPPTIRESGKYDIQSNPIHLLSGSLAWVDQTLDTEGSGLFAAGQNGLSSLTDANGGQHVFYISGNGHVCQQTAPPYTAGCVPWTLLDVTSATPSQGSQAWTANAGVNAGAIASFDDASGAYHIVAVGSDGYVFLLSYDPVSKAWSGTSFEGTAEQVAPGSGLSGFVDSNGIYIFYIAKDNSVRHLLNANPGSAGSTWVDRNLTAIATEDPSGNPKPNAAQASSLSSFSDEFGEHAVYIGTDQHVHQFSHSLNWTDSQWTDQDLTLLANAFLGSTKPPAAQSSALSCFANPNTSNSNVEWIFYIGNDQHVHLLTFAPQPQWPPLGGGGNGPLQAPQCPSSNTGINGQLYTVTLNASGGEPPYTFNVDPLPPGLTVKGNQLTGTPSKTGTFQYSVTVTDATGSTSKSVSCSIVINGPLPQLSCPTDVAFVNKQYNSTVPVVGGTPPYTFALASSSNLPPGLNFSSTGTAYTISGIPTMEGNFQVTVLVTDSTGATAQSNSCPIIVSGSFQVTAQLFLQTNWNKQRDKQPTFSWSLDGPASGLTFVTASDETPVDSTEFPVGSGNYTISGVMSGTELSLGPSSFTLCTATPGPTPSPTRSWSFKVAAGTTKIYVYGPLIVDG